MRAAEELLVHASQESKLGSHIDALKKGAALPQDSRLRNLAVFLEPKGTLRLKSPATLDGDHRVTRLYIHQLHPGALLGPPTSSDGEDGAESLSALPTASSRAGCTADGRPSELQISPPSPTVHFRRAQLLRATLRDGREAPRKKVRGTLRLPNDARCPPGVSGQLQYRLCYYGAAELDRPNSCIPTSDTVARTARIVVLLYSPFETN